jgi:hypothetical protein
MHCGGVSPASDEGARKGSLVEFDKYEYRLLDTSTLHAYQVTSCLSFLTRFGTCQLLIFATSLFDEAEELALLLRPYLNISASPPLLKPSISSHETVQNVCHLTSSFYPSPSSSHKLTIPQGKSNLRPLFSNLHPLLHTLLNLQTLPRLPHRTRYPNSNASNQPA